MAMRIRRNGHTVDYAGFIHHDDVPVELSEIEAIAGHKLDRRKSYAIIDGNACESATWSQQCSGCEGGGCHECGYHGTVKCGQWIPLLTTDPPSV